MGDRHPGKESGHGAQLEQEKTALSPYPWGTDRRFHAYSDHLRKQFGFRLQKLSLHAGFSCPNRDGSKGYGGCIFCNNEAFNPSYCQSGMPITRQLEEGKSFHAWRYRKSVKYIAYFQSFSNTYAPLPVLKERYLEALRVPDVVGLSIGTRPDCVDDAILDYLQELSQQYFIHLEMGIESCYDKALQWMRRGHDFDCAVQAFNKAAERGLSTGTHLIVGLPCLSREEELEQASILSSLPIRTLKLHQLQIMKNTALEDWYRQHKEEFKPFTLESYLDFCVDFLERLSPDIRIERLAGEAPPRFQAGPTFGNIRTDRVLQLFEKKMDERQAYQGRLYDGK